MEIGDKRKDINSFLPAPINRVSKGVGSFVNVYFKIDPETEGHIWIYLCDWALLNGESKLESSMTIQDDLKLRTFFSGERLFRLETMGPKSALILSAGKRLDMQANRAEYGDDDMFITYIPGQPPAGYGPVPGSPDEYGWNFDDLHSS